MQEDRDPRISPRLAVPLGEFEGEVVWQSDVFAFELDGHPTAHRCFAWEVDGELTVMLAEGPVASAQAAVSVSIMGDPGNNPETR